MNDCPFLVTATKPPTRVKQLPPEPYSPNWDMLNSTLSGDCVLSYTKINQTHKTQEQKEWGVST